MLEQPVDVVQKHAGGRPPKVTVEEKVEVYKAFERYIETEDYPTIVDFCSTNKVARKYRLISQNIKDWQQFSSLIKQAIDKQERYTEYGVMHGKIPPVWGIFKFKQPQHGWTDKQEVEHSGSLEIKRGMAPEELDAIIQRSGQAGLLGTAGSGAENV